MSSQNKVYKYDTHVHTSQSSLCAKSKGEELVEYYASNGYSGFIVTDHFIGSNNFLAKNERSWEKKICSFYEGYENAKKFADQIDFDVFFAMEYCYENTEFIFLNINFEQILHGQKELEQPNLPEVLNWVHRQGGIVIHVHPFRVTHRINTVRLLPYFIDAVEVFNGGNVISWPDANRHALYYANEIGVSVTSGTDLHSIKDTITGGMEFTHRIRSEAEFAQAILNNEGRLIQNSLF